jgi:hypothetical protein
MISLVEPEHFGAISTCPAGNPGECLRMPDDCSNWSAGYAVEEKYYVPQK